MRERRSRRERDCGLCCRGRRRLAMVAELLEQMILADVARAWRTNRPGMNPEQWAAYHRFRVFVMGHQLNHRN